MADNVLHPDDDGLPPDGLTREERSYQAFDRAYSGVSPDLTFENKIEPLSTGYNLDFPEEMYPSNPRVFEYDPRETSCEG